MTNSDWVTTKDLLKNLLLSERSFYKLKKAGVFTAGEDYYFAGVGKVKGKRIWSIKKCREALKRNSK